MAKAKPVKVDIQPFDEFKNFAPYTKRIRTLCDGVVGTAIEIGQILLEAQAEKARGRTGVFQRWITEELGFSVRQAYNFMQAAEVFGEFCAKFAHNISDSAMYVLAAPSAPEAAREAAIGIAEQGGRVTHKKAVQLVEAYKKPEIEQEFVPLTELAKWRKALSREYDRYPEQWRRDFVEETVKFVTAKQDASDAQ